MGKGKKKRKNQQKKVHKQVEKVENDTDKLGSSLASGLASLESTTTTSSPLTERLPFASPTLQLLQQEKLLGIKAHQSHSFELAGKHFSHALHLASESYPEQLPSLYSSLGLVHLYLKVFTSSHLFSSLSYFPSLEL